METMWLIWSNEHNGWWAPARQGYNRERKRAGRYTFKEALEIVENANAGADDCPNECMVREDAFKYAFP